MTAFSEINKKLCKPQCETLTCHKSEPISVLLVFRYRNKTHSPYLQNLLTRVAAKLVPNQPSLFQCLLASET